LTLVVELIVLDFARGLSPRVVRALADLERRTVAVDGGRLKLEWGVLGDRTGHQVEDILFWDGDRLLGFLGMYGFAVPTVELAGMVDPATRRRGIATRLVDAALPLCRERGYDRVLLVTPRAGAAGKGFALRCGAVLEHSEHALVLTTAPADGPTDPRIRLRTATAADAPEISRLLTAAFGRPPSDVLEALASKSERTLLVEMSGSVIGTLRANRRGEDGGVYGFAIDPAWQGRGIGRDVLRRVCHQLREAGVQRVGLEVAVENEHALALYTSIGFARVTTEDYYALPCT